MREIDPSDDHFSAIEKSMSTHPSSFFSMIRRIRGYFRIAFSDDATLELLGELVKERSETPEYRTNRDFRANLDGLSRALESEIRFREHGLATTEPKTATRVESAVSTKVSEAVGAARERTVPNHAGRTKPSFVKPDSGIRIPPERPKIAPIATQTPIRISNPRNEPEARIAETVEIPTGTDRTTVPKPTRETASASGTGPRVFRMRRGGEKTGEKRVPLGENATPREKALRLGELPEVRQFFEQKIVGRAFPYRFEILMTQLRRRGALVNGHAGVAFKFPETVAEFAKMLDVEPAKKAIVEALGYETSAKVAGASSSEPKKPRGRRKAVPVPSVPNEEVRTDETGDGTDDDAPDGSEGISTVFDKDAALRIFAACEKFRRIFLDMKKGLGFGAEYRDFALRWNAGAYVEKREIPVRLPLSVHTLAEILGLPNGKGKTLRKFFAESPVPRTRAPRTATRNVPKTERSATTASSDEFVSNVPRMSAVRKAEIFAFLAKRFSSGDILAAMLSGLRARLGEDEFSELLGELGTKEPESPIRTADNAPAKAAVVKTGIEKVAKKSERVPRTAVKKPAPVRSVREDIRAEKPGADDQDSERIAEIDEIRAEMGEIDEIEAEIAQESATAKKTERKTRAKPRLEEGRPGTASESPQFSHLSRIAYRSPLLSHEESLELFRRLREENDRSAYDTLVESNVRLIFHVARKYLYVGKFDDHFQEGFFGLHRAIEKYEPAFGFRFSTYAIHWIRQSILRAIGNNERTIRMPVHAGEKSKKYNLLVDLMTRENGGERPSEEALAERMGLSVEKMRKFVDRESASRVASLDVPAFEGEHSATLHDQIGDEAEWSDPVAVLEKKIVSERVAAVLDDARLNEKERTVIEGRFGLSAPHYEALTLEAVGGLMNVTRERVRQIETTAKRKIRASLERAGLTDMSFFS